jgi:hypothetical protein
MSRPVFVICSCSCSLTGHTNCLLLRSNYYMVRVEERFVTIRSLANKKDGNRRRFGENHRHCLPYGPIPVLDSEDFVINKNGSRRRYKYGEMTDENRRWNIKHNIITVFSFHHHKIATEVRDRGPDHGNRRLVSLITK